MPAGPKKPSPITPEEKKTAERAAGRRRRWEKGAGAERMKQAHELMPGHEKLGVGGTYAHHSWGFKVGHGETPMGQGILHGMEAPGAAPEMRRWEDLHPHEQERTLRHLGKWGTSLHHMERAFGAQLDQAFHRAHHDTEARGEFGMTYPKGQDFYSPDSDHGQVVHGLAKKHNLHPSVASAVVALTSPNTKWHQSGRYPNAETADHVIRHVLSGGDPTKVHETAFMRHPETGEIETHKTSTKSAKKGDPKKLQGYGDNMVKAAVQLESHLRTGSGFTGFGPKTGPFHNSFNDYTHDFLVNDVHTGGGGMLPHLSSHKPLVRHAETGEVMRDAEGKEKRDKSEREKAINTVPNFHAAADYVARQALQKRGLSSIRRSQATQWDEEQHRRAEQHSNFASVIATPQSRASEFIAGHTGHHDHPSLF
jgi:hypothetical protein